MTPDADPRSTFADGAVRLCVRSDRATVAALLARAFANDPAMTWIFPDPAERARRMPRLFALLFDEDAAQGMRLVTTGSEAVTLWRSPGHLTTSRWDMLRQAWPMWRALGANMARAVAVADSFAAHAPREPVWYLHIAGCDPAAQGQGFGGAAVRAGLDRAAGRLPAYLETATESNLGFYGALGFRIVDEWRVRGELPFWSMLRPADTAV